MPTDRTGQSAGLAALQLVLEEEQYRALPAEDLLGRYLNDRDERAFAALVRRYGRLVMARCREVLRREDLAQEAFQETYTQLVVNGHAVKKRGAVGRWLARTARRRSLNVARRERRQRGRDLSTPRPVAASDPASMLDAQDSGRAIAHALSALPERLRLPIELVYLDGHTHAEAAAALDWPKGTVDSYIRRGLARLKPILARTGIPAIALGAANLPMRAEAVPPDWIVRAVADAQRAAARPAAALSSWTVPLKIAGIVAAAGLAVSAGVAFWPASKRTPVSPPVAPNVPVVVESLPAANLRLLQSEIGPKVCEALKGITKDGQPPTILETEAYDSRVRVMIEACFRPKLPDVGEKSRSVFYFDTGRRTTYLFLDRNNDGTWKPINLEHPIILVQETGGKIILSKQIPELTAAVKVLDDFPRDPRAEAAVDKRREALREKLSIYAGRWYIDGDPKKSGWVELTEPLGLEFYEPGATMPSRVLTEEEIWACEAGSRAWPIKEGGMLGHTRVGLQDGGQTMICWPVGELWKRPAGK